MNKLHLHFLFLLLLSACAKKDTQIEGRLIGKVEHKYTHAGIPNITVQIKEMRPGIFSPDVTILDSAVTDEQGLFELTTHVPSSTYTYVVETRLAPDFDTTVNSYQFIPGSLKHTGVGLQSPVVLGLEPSGYIKTVVKSADWNAVGSDSIEVISPYASGWLRPRRDGIYFYVEPARNHIF